MNKTTSLIIGIIIVVVIAFYLGDRYGKNSAPVATTRSGGMAGGQRGMRGGGNGGGFTVGEVLSKDDKSITVKLRSGGSEIVFLSTKTPVSKSVDGSLDDITVGSQVMVSGTPNSDGSLNAQSVQIRPAAPATTTPTTN